MTDIPQYATFTKIEPLTKGFSGDKKYRVETSNGQRLILRVADIAEYERKRAEFDMLKHVAELDIPATRPVDFGECDDGASCYQLLTWIDGEGYAAVEGYAHIHEGRDDTVDFKGPVRLYEKLGFVRAAERDGEVVMREVL